MFVPERASVGIRTVVRVWEMVGFRMQFGVRIRIRFGVREVVRSGLGEDWGLG